MASRKWQDVSPALSPWILDTVASFGFDNMTPVQASVIPLLRKNKDVVVEAVTGSGKTLAFVIPIIERILSLDEKLGPGQMNSIIVSPTRELADQIYRVIVSILDMYPDPVADAEVEGVAAEKPKRQVPIRCQLVVGGAVTTHADIKIFQARRPHIVVATPGRLLELLSSNQVRTNALDTLIFDEADRLLDLGFDNSISKILAMLPKQKRVGLFSATISDAVSEVVRLGMRNPVKVVVSSGSSSKSRSRVPTSLGLSYCILEPSQKIPLLMHMLHSLEFKKAIVYFPTCTAVTYFYSLLTHLQAEFGDKDNVPQLFSLHGKLPPGPRHKTLDKFSNAFSGAVLLTTDVAARGLDIPEVDVVIQLDPPQDPNVFLHRAGRAGRAGRQGWGVVFLNNGLEESYVDFMKVRNVDMTEYEDPRTEKKTYSEAAREWVLEDRARHDLGVKSFVSYIRFYSKHSASSIFRVQSLDLVAAARAHYLLRLPKMPELKTLPANDLPEGGWLGEAVDMDSYKYTNRQQEEARQAELAKREQRPIREKKEVIANNTKAWSAKVERKETAAQRREKRKNRQIAKTTAAMDGADSDSEAEVDWKDLVREKKRVKQAAVASFDGL